MIYFPPPTINLISQPSSRSFYITPTPSSSRNPRGSEEKGRGSGTTTRCKNQIPFNSFWLLLLHFLRVDLKQGWAASWISYSLLSVFIYNSTYLQITGGTSALTLAPNPRSDVLQYTIKFLMLKFSSPSKQKNFHREAPFDDN